MADGLFSGLEAFGLSGLEGVNLFEEEEKKKAAAAAAAVQLTEKDFLLDKAMTCPVCDSQFKAKMVKTGKARLIGQDMDLRPKYQEFDVTKYDVIGCPICGYTALMRYFPTILDVQKKRVREKICMNFRGNNEYPETYSYEQAAMRYKLALVNAAVKGAKASEIGYICLKAAWIMRGWAEEAGEGTPVYNQAKTMESDYLKNAYEGFTKAVSQESFPMCGMDESTIDYLLAALSYETNHIDVAQKMIAKILTSSSANSRMKDKARDIKDEIIKKLKAQQ